MTFAYTQEFGDSLSQIRHWVSRQEGFVEEFACILSSELAVTYPGSAGLSQHIGGRSTILLSRSTFFLRDWSSLTSASGSSSAW